MNPPDHHGPAMPAHPTPSSKNTFPSEFMLSDKADLSKELLAWLWHPGIKAIIPPGQAETDRPASEGSSGSTHDMKSSEPVWADAAAEYRRRARIEGAVRK